MKLKKLLQSQLFLSPLWQVGKRPNNCYRITTAHSVCMMISDKRVHTNQSLASQIDRFDLPKLSKWCISQPFPCPHPCFCPLAECPLPPLPPCHPARITDAYRSLSSVGELASAICPVCRPTTPVKTNLNGKATHILLIACVQASTK